MPCKCLRSVLSFCLLMGIAVAGLARPPEALDLFGDTSVSGQGVALDDDRATVWFGGVDQFGIAVVGGTWDFTDGTTQGWTSETPFMGLTRRVLVSDFTGDPASPMFGGLNLVQIWCGLHESEADEMGYASGMGYGDEWCQTMRSPILSISAGNSVALNFKYLTDSEDGYDSTTVYVVTYDPADVVLERYRVAMFTGVNGTPVSPSIFNQTIPFSSFSPAPSKVALEFQFLSDAAWSDEDGSYDSTYGPFSFDNVSITIGAVPYSYTFESGGLQGWTLDACMPMPPLMGVVGAGTYASWLTYAGVTSCTLSGNALEDVGDIGDPPGRPPGHWETLSSPVIARGSYLPPTYNTTVLRYDMYWSFLNGTGTYYRPGHRYYDTETGWSAVRPFNDFWWFTSSSLCQSYVHNLGTGSNPVPADWESLRVVIEVATDCDAFGQPTCPSEGQTKGSPIFDNIRIGLSAGDVRTCCLAQNVCQQLTEAECLAQGGEWLSSLTTCVPNPCGQAYVIEADGSGDFPTIQAGVNASFYPDTLILGEGTFTGAGNRDVDCLGKNLVIRSRLDDPALCVVDCERLGRGFVFADTEDTLATLQGVTILNGMAEDGGGIYIAGSSPTVTNCVLTYNSAALHGGGVYCTGRANPTFTSCIFTLNEAGSGGGGLFAESGAEATISYCTFDHNVTRGLGATIATPEASVLVVDHSILAFGVGGVAVHCLGDTDVPVLTCCDVFGNEGGDYVGCISDQLGVRNNFTGDPLFCADGNPVGPYAVSEDSPCAAENNPTCGVVGVRGLGCAVLNVDPVGGGEYATIQSAADAAFDGDVILLEPGTYIERSSTGVSMGGKPIIIRSQSRGRQSATIDCQGVKRGFIFYTGEGPGSVLDGLRIINGSELFGGAVFCSSGTSPTIHECLFLSNRADSAGGGVCCWSGASPFIADCTFQSDTASVGGGLAVMGNASPRIDRCRFIDNVATLGGGAHVGGSAAPDLFHCTFDGNYGQVGGGVFSEAWAHPAIENCTLVRNAAPTGGGIHALGSLLTLTRSIVAFGTQGEAVGGSAFPIACSDLYSNAGGDWVGPIAAQSGWVGNFSLDPRFCDLPGDDLRIWNHSPCNIVICGPVGAWPVGCSVPLGVDPESPQGSPLAASLSVSSFPNPFAGMTTIRFAVPRLPEATRVQVRVFGVTGQLVRALLDEPMRPGSYSMDWDGRDGSGGDVASGVYFIRVKIGGWEAARSTLRVR